MLIEDNYKKVVDAYKDDDSGNHLVYACVCGQMCTMLLRTIRANHFFWPREFSPIVMINNPALLSYVKVIDEELSIVLIDISDKVLDMMCKEVINNIHNKYGIRLVDVSGITFQRVVFRLHAQDCEQSIRIMNSYSPYTIKNASINLSNVKLVIPTMEQMMEEVSSGNEVMIV